MQHIMFVGSNWGPIKCTNRFLCVDTDQLGCSQHSVWACTNTVWSVMVSVQLCVGLVLGLCHL